MEVASRMEVVLGARDVMHDSIPSHPLRYAYGNIPTYMLGSIHSTYRKTLLRRIFERLLQRPSI